MSAWGLPVRGGYVTSSYGPRSSPGGVGSTWHRGLDIGGRGTDWLVRSVGGGYVLATGSNTVRGLWVAVRHTDGSTTAYQHLADIRVMVGQNVAVGTPVGRMGMSGTSTATHLHMEALPAGRWLRSGTAWASTDRAVDPEPYLRARGVDVRRGVVTVANTGGPGGGALPTVPDLTPPTPIEEAFMPALTDDEQRRLLEAADMLRGHFMHVKGRVDATYDYARDTTTRTQIIRAQGDNITNGVLTLLGRATGADVDESALAAELAPLLIGSLGSLSDADVQRIAAAAADEQARRLAGPGA